MLNFEYRTTKDYRNNLKEYVVVNGIEDLRSFTGDREPRYIHIYHEEAISTVCAHSFYQVGKHCRRVSFGLDREWWNDDLEVDLTCNEFYDIDFPQITLTLRFQDWDQWNKPWSMSQVAAEIGRLVEASTNPRIQYYTDDEESILNGFGMVYKPTNTNSLIHVELEFALQLLESIVKECYINLQRSLDTESVISYFEFPAGIKAACHQYLIYFSQFLSDLSIEVDAEVKDHLNKTLFKVTPRDKEESLEKIKDALAIYLSSPTNPEFERQIQDNANVAALQWQANVYHLKSQLALSQGLLELKDATTNQLKLSNFQLENKRSQTRNEEKIVGEFIKVKEYDGSWFSINLPAFVRLLKRTFQSSM